MVLIVDGWGNPIGCIEDETGKEIFWKEPIPYVSNAQIILVGWMGIFGVILVIIWASKGGI